MASVSPEKEAQEKYLLQQVREGKVSLALTLQTHIPEAAFLPPVHPFGSALQRSSLVLAVARVSLEIGEYLFLSNDGLSTVTQDGTSVEGMLFIVGASRHENIVLRCHRRELPLEIVIFDTVLRAKLTGIRKNTYVFQVESVGK